MAGEKVVRSGEACRASDSPWRCPWAKTPLGIQYHDQEWGVPIHDDRRLFEFLALSGIQAGLSWEIVLKKRLALRGAFAQFNPTIVARYDGRKLSRLLANAELVRNRRKLEAVIHNSRRLLEVAEEFGSFDAYLWRFVDGVPIVNRWRRPAETPTSSAVSDRLSRDLRQRGFQFAGTTICYAFMQSVGMVNDHLLRCFRHKELAA
jgi:DNA-3-methyladenine glycosylase I